MANDKAENRYRAPALDKGLDIVELLAGFVDGMTLGEIARALDKSQSEIYRMITTLVRRGYVVRSAEDDRFSLSLKMFAVSQRHAPVNRLLDVARPKMRTLALHAWQSCHLAMENNGDIVIVSSAESPGNWALGLRVGSVVGLWNTGSGRVLAAFRSEDELEELLNRHRPALGEPELDRDELMRHLERVRRNGYERMPSSATVGVTNMAYPVMDENGRAVAAVTCPYLERIDEFEVPSVDKVHAMLTELAAELSAFYCGEMG
ncbi:DNA-binding transcriptional regulator, IclR family [Paracoccus isoporae]|uniref:DNA-binding transcriptional regulator, IclR family n=1 Tax=Paracoccus isoporae TaxID=591205 RepID=A0A1G7E7V6_9RHOB|nr:DNA-binding transcriptional regulator, IclR family [Paracoccus isoporae]